MSRDFQINGECLVKVKGAAGSDIATVQELGLAVDRVIVSPKFYHTAVHTDDFGPDVPAEVLWSLAECTITMTLIHYDNNILDVVIRESAAGRSLGFMAGAGKPLGSYKPLFDKDCHYVSLNLLSPQLGEPWRFPTTYLAGTPAVYPLGVQATAVALTWRAIPYTVPNPGSPGQPIKELKSKSTVLFDHNLDVDP